MTIKVDYKQFKAYALENGMKQLLKYCQSKYPDLKLYKIRSKHTEPEDKLITKWKPGAYSERFKKLLKRHKLEHTRLHDLRHYNATIMMHYNVPDKVAAKRLGHANTVMLKKTYQHVLKGMDENAALQINNAFEQKNSQQASNT
jgi:integrase